MIQTYTNCDQGVLDFDLVEVELERLWDVDRSKEGAPPQVSHAFLFGLCLVQARSLCDEVKKEAAGAD